MPHCRFFHLPLALLPFFAASPLFASSPAAPSWSGVVPVLEEACMDCHDESSNKGGVNLERLLADPKLFSEFELWSKVAEVVKNGDMPPRDELAAADKKLIVGWLDRELDKVARANAGDPGLVTIRRLTNVEYDNTVRALTNIDLNLSADFLPDGGGGEGFSNVGDVLFVSPQQLDKYLAAARKLSEHATILPGTGITFHTQRIGLRGPEQVRDQVEQGLYIWYQKMASPFLPNDGEDLREAEYMLACWKFQHKNLTGAQSLDQLARDARLFAPFLHNWWNLLTMEKPPSRFLDLTRVPWRQLPPPDPANPQAVPGAVHQQLAAIQAQRRSWWEWDKPGRGVQRMQQDADGLRIYGFTAEVKGDQPVHFIAGDLGDGNRGDYALITDIRIKRPKAKPEPYLDWLRRRLEQDRESLAALTQNQPPPEKARFDAPTLEKRIREAETALGLFGKHPLGLPVEEDVLVLHAPVVVSLPVGEDASILGRGQLDLRPPDAEFATVQWTATAGPPPDPGKIIPGVLTLWKRGTPAHRETMSDFGRMKSAFPDEYNRRLEEVARNYTRGGKGSGVYYLSDDQIVQLISSTQQERFPKMLTDLRLTSSRKLKPEDEKAWDDALLAHLRHFASKTWRRPLAEAESAQLAGLYQDARSRDLDRESAAREVLVRVFIAPDFLFKLEDAAKPGEHPVSSWELATRLSYFLWSSPPDNTLRQLCADGSLLQPDILARETRRMLKDPRIASLAREFTGQWLQFSGFDKHTGIDSEKFPEFTPELRADMHRETIEFFTHLLREDRPVREILLADYTFLNERLAKHYNIPGVKGSQFQQVKVASHQRGGLLGMGSILTKTSFPQRTSPVLRGNWLLASVLGTPTPPPPADVPELDDSASKATSLRAKLEAHRASKACSSCHDKIDPLGFALEAYDPIGRFRSTDEAGLPIDTAAALKDGTPIHGMQGLRDYLATRNTEFETLLSRKLVGYALGRTIQPTDKVLIETMVAAMDKAEGRFSAAVLTLVQSRQFQNRRNE